MLDKVQFLIDGYPVEKDIIDEFDLRSHSRNLRYSSALKSDVLDFVGFIIKDDKILAAFPKHYVSVENLSILNEIDMSLLFNTLIKNELDKNQSYIGDLADYESNYPFKSFFEVYKYYLNYGLFQEANNSIKPGYNGKISWKDTIRKSQVIMSQNSLILMPLYVKKMYSEQVFLTECMAYVINHTVDKFSAFLNLKGVRGINVQSETFKNKEFVISKLQLIYAKTFKDIEKKLIQSLMDFFKGFNEGGNMVFKHYNFELVWESMVDGYLNTYFVGIKDGLPLFDSSLTNSSKNFKKKSFYINSINEKHKIEPDHYCIDGSKQYIFDSKYYVDLKRIDYKQIAYHSILKSFIEGETFNVLILPTSGESKSEYYFELNEEYYTRDVDKISIITSHLNMKVVIETYTQHI